MDLKTRLLDGETLLGSFLGIPSPPLVEMLGHAGYDFIILDAEHGVFNPVVMEDCLRAAATVGIPAVVRVAAPEARPIQAALDLGASGVQVPQVETAKEARMAVRFSRFPPGGERGYGSSTRAAAYGFRSREAVREKAQEEIVINVQIESKTGVDNLEGILEVEGIDIVFIGTSDLSMSYGYDSPNDPAMSPLIKHLITAIEVAGKRPGMYLSDWSKIEHFLGLGVRFFTVSAGVVIKEAFSRQVKEFALKVKNGC